jgi:hypothetical protein
MAVRHSERHRTERIGWIRAAVLGANDGIVSTASLVLGVAAANATHGNVMIAGIAGLVAGAMSMAAGEYVSSAHKPIPTGRAQPGTPGLEADDRAAPGGNDHVSRGLDSARKQGRPAHGP